jgi:hypothetical protein
MITLIGWIIAVTIINLSLGAILLPRAHPSNRRLHKVTIAIITVMQIVSMVANYLSSGAVYK